MGLELNTSFKKSSVSILHFPFSSVQFRLRFRWLCLSFAFSFFDVVWKVKCDDDTSCYTTSMMSHLSVQLCAHHCLHHENSDASRLPRSGSKLKANSSLERTQGTVHALWSLVSHSCTCAHRIDISTHRLKTAVVRESICPQSCECHRLTCFFIVEQKEFHDCCNFLIPKILNDARVRLKIYWFFPKNCVTHHSS